MKRIAALVLAICMVACMFAGCSSSKSYTFKVSTGDDIKVTLDTSEGHKLSQDDGEFYVSSDDKELLKGFFLEEDEAEEYLDEIPNSDYVEILAEGSNNYGDYIFYEDNEEWIYIVLLDGTDTGICITGIESEEDTVECIDLLGFACEDEDVEPSDDTQLPDYDKDRKPAKYDDRDDGKDETVPEETTEPAETVPDETEAVTSNTNFVETVLYDANDIKITATSLNYLEGWGYDLGLLIENNNANKMMTFNSDSFIINGISISVSCYADVEAGETCSEVVTIYDKQLEVANISEIATIESYDGAIFVGETYYEDFYDAPFSITIPGMENYEQVINDEGVVIVDQDGIKIVAQDMSYDDFGGYNITLFIANNTGKNVSVEADDISVNGFMVDGWMYQNVPADTVSYGKVDIYFSDLENNKITDISEVGLNIEVTDQKDHETIFETGEIILTLE